MGLEGWLGIVLGQGVLISYMSEEDAGELRVVQARNLEGEGLTFS